MSDLLTASLDGLIGLGALDTGVLGLGGSPFGANLLGIPFQSSLLGLLSDLILSAFDADARAGEGVSERFWDFGLLGVLSNSSSSTRSSGLFPPSNMEIRLPAVPILSSSTTFSRSSTAVKLPALILLRGLGLTLRLAARVAAMKLAFFPSWPLLPGGCR